MKNIYLIGANNWQLWPLYLDFQDKGNVIPVILSSKDKDANTNNFILLYAHALEMGYKGRSSFSYEHTIKFFDVSFFKSINKLIAYILRRWSFKRQRPPRTQINTLLKIYRTFFHRPIQSITKNDEVVFCSLMQTKLETDYFLSAKTVGAKCVYYPGNWDNPSSKLTSVLGKFDVGYFWTDSMKADMDQSAYFKTLVNRPNYRLRYIKSKQKDYKPKNKVQILIALSQKTKGSLDNLIEKLKLQLVDFSNYKIRIRLHPFNSKLHINTTLGKNIEVIRPDVSIINKVKFLDSYRYYQDYETEMFESIKNADVVVVEGGTIALEAINLKKPVIIFSIERKNRTALVFNHFEHFRKITSCSGCLALFDETYLLEKCNELLEYSNVDVIDDLRLKFQ